MKELRWKMVQLLHTHPYTQLELAYAIDIIDQMLALPEMQSLISYHDCYDDVNRLVRMLDEIWNGKEGMAEQASLCDMVAQIKKEYPVLKEKSEKWDNLQQLQHSQPRIITRAEDRISELEKELELRVERSSQQDVRISDLNREVAQARESAKLWKEEANNYCKNSYYWQDQLSLIRSNTDEITGEWVSKFTRLSYTQVEWEQVAKKIREQVMKGIKED